MKREELTSDGLEIISSLIDKTAKNLYARGLHALERAPINDGIQFIRGLQQESGGFALMEGEEATPLMTGYALLAMGLVGMRVDDPAPKAALTYLKAVQHSSGGIPYYIDSGPSLGPTAIVTQALKNLYAPRSHSVLQACQKFLSVKLREGIWRESFTMNGEGENTVEVALTSMCVGALGDALLSSDRQKVMLELLKVRNHDGGWGWSKGYDSEVDHTALALIALKTLSNLETDISNDVITALEYGKEFLLSCQNVDGGFSQRGARDEASAIDSAGLAAHALSLLGTPTDEPVRRAASFFLRTQNSDGGWGDKAGSDSDIDSTFFVLQALMSSGETIITLQEAENSIRDLQSGLQDLFEERICTVTNERDELSSELKDAERKVRLLEAAIGIIITIATFLLASVGLPGFG